MGPGEVAAAVARELRERGAEGVALMGSHARGDAHAHSDLDIVAVGSGTSRMRLVDGVLVSEAWLSADAARDSWRAPEEVGQTVPGWRSARPLLDPEGVVAGLHAEAERWRWDDLGDAPDRWVAAELAGYAEEVYRLVGHLRRGNDLAAAVMRNVLANRMAWVMAVHLRLLYETENRLWDLVGEQLGAAWRTDQRRAFGIDTDFDASCRAALHLYRRTSELAGATLSDEQRAVVTAAIGVAEA